MKEVDRERAHMNDESVTNRKKPENPEITARYLHYYRRKVRFYRHLYQFTFAQCGACVGTGCACKDRICQHVEEQARRRGIELKPVGKGVRFIGPRGCVVPPHLRETCTIYICDSAQRKNSFERRRYEKLKSICNRIDWKMMELEEKEPALSKLAPPDVT